MFFFEKVYSHFGNYSKIGFMNFFVHIGDQLIFIKEIGLSFLLSLIDLLIGIVVFVVDKELIKQKRQGKNNHINR